jgi:hypothetical protein
MDFLDISMENNWISDKSARLLMIFKLIPYEFHVNSKLIPPNSAEFLKEFLINYFDIR